MNTIRPRPVVAMPFREGLALGAMGVLMASAACGGSGGGNNGGTIFVPIDLDGSSTSDTGTIGISRDGGTGGSDGGTTGHADTGTGGQDVSQPPPNPAMIAMPLVGCVPSEYNATFAVGSQTFSLSLDTGSTTLGVASTECSGCGVSPLYSPGATAHDEGMMVTSQYGTGSWSGEVYQDSVGVPEKSDSAAVRLVAIDTQSQFFEPMQCGANGGSEGIIGFGPAASAVMGTNAFFDQLVAATGMPNVFATELCDTTGTLWLGGYDPSATTAAPQYVPYSSDFFAQYYYAINLTSITVGGVTTAIASGQFTDSLVDTGTSVFLLGTTAYTGLVNALAATPGFAQVFGSESEAQSFLSSPENCKALSQTKAELDAILPPLTLTFGSVNVQASATESYLISYEGEWCASMDETEQGDDSFPFASIMGSPILRSNIVIFDRANSRIGFAPHAASCE